MYHVFTYCEYYPCGGVNDYEGSFEFLEEAISEAARQVNFAARDHAHIARSNEDGTLEIVWKMKWGGVVEGK